MRTPFKMKGWGGYQSSPLRAKKKQFSTKEDDPSYKKEGEYTQYKHPKYYNEDGSVKQGDTDEGELSKVKKDKSGRKYVKKSSDIGGGKLYLDPPK